MVRTMTLQASSTTTAAKSRGGRPAWLLFILTLQGQQPAVRMRVWRALKALGAAVLRDGVYLLPNRIEFIEPLKTQSEDVIASDGSAQILELNARDDAQEAEFVQLFDRTPDYKELMLTIHRARKETGSLDAAALSARLARLRRDYEAIALQDFFPGGARDQTGEALEDLSAAANAVLSPDEPHAAPGRIQRMDPGKYQG